VADLDHPITRGLAAWELTDETYTVNLPGTDSHVLLTTDHPKCMRTVGWTREVGKSRVFCLQSGHDNAAFSNPNFGAVLQRGIEWLAER
jgi:type 1 glutamine amidotransferase